MDLSGQIKKQAGLILAEIPEGVKLVAAAKTRSAEEVNAAVSAGISIIGENYVRETVDVKPFIKGPVSWHFIGHLQKNKVKKAVDIFDVIETVDSPELAAEIDKRCAVLNKTMPVFIEVNSGREKQKYGVFPEEVEPLIKDISSYKNLKIKGLMTMGPFSGDPEEARPYFRETKAVFDRIRDMDFPGTNLEFLSMGMTNSYKVAIQEGANIIRIGTKIFGARS
jgi:hypothetical protein